MKLEDYILSYEINDEIVVDLFEYYDKFIRTLDERFKPYSFYNNKLVLCWFKDHEDINPSMGYIPDKFHKGQKLYHCFGCGKTGDIIRLNQIIESQYHNNDLDRKESCLDLAKKFNIPLDDYENFDEEDREVQYLRRLKKLDKLKNMYTYNDFARTLRHLRLKSDIDLNVINSECVKMIATVKQLYN